MPLVNMPENPPKPMPEPKPVPATIAPPVYKHNLVDITLTPVDSLLTHIEGMSWTVDIYSQLLSENEQPTPYQPNQLPPYQQYLSIKGFELKLQAGLEPTHNTEEGTMSMSGTARVFPVWRPHVGDVIIASVGDGRVGQFTVTQATRLSLYDDAVYEINFELSRIATADVIAELNRRVIKEAFFREEFLTYGQNPVLIESQVNLVDSIKTTYQKILRQWLHQFFSNEYSTLVIPGQSGAVYDPYLVRAALNVFDVEEHTLIRRIKSLNVDGINAMNDYSVLDALIHADESYLIPGHKATGLLARRSFPKIPTLNGIYFTGVTHVVFPVETEKHVDVDYGAANPLTAGILTSLQDVQEELDSVIPDNVAGGDEPPPAPNPFFHAVLFDDGYIFTRNFYEEAATGQSKLEILVRTALRAESINTTMLFEVIEKRSLFGRLEHFYYDFVLMILLRIALRQI